jgi:hypothetical protein
MGLVRILFIGIAAGAAYFALRKAQPAEAPEGEAQAPHETGPQDPISALKHRADEALAAGREAKADKEAELQRQFEDAKRGAAR